MFLSAAKARVVGDVPCGDKDAFVGFARLAGGVEVAQGLDAGAGDFPTLAAS